MNNSFPAVRNGDVWVLGDNAIDEYVGAHEGIYAGGDAGNVAAQIALAGIPVNYGGAIADDKDGNMFRDLVAGIGVNLDALEVLEGKTARCKIRLTEDASRIFEEEFYGVSAKYWPNDSTLDALLQAKWIHISYFLRAKEFKALMRSRGYTGVISQDMAVCEGFENVDVAFGSGSMVRMGFADYHAAALAAGVQVLVITLGADGAVAYDRNLGIEFHDALAANPIDTNGAGDSFQAGFITAAAAEDFAVLTGSSLQDALRIASEFAARCCGHYGGWPQD